MTARVEPLLRVGHEAALIAAADVGAHRDLPPILAARDDARAVDHLDLRELRQRHASAFARGDQDVADRRDVGARLRDIADRDIEAALAFEHRAHGAAADRHLDHVLAHPAR